MISLSIKDTMDIIEALREASDTISKFEEITTKSNLPDTFRYPMADELYGLSLMLGELVNAK